MQFKESGLFRAKRELEERIGTSLDLVQAGDSEAIRLMEENMRKETIELRDKLLSEQVEDRQPIFLTTYFARVKKMNPYLNYVSIALKTPPGFPGRQLLELAPTSQMLYDIKTTGDIEKYTREFRERLRRLDIFDVVEKLGPEAILVCYEGVGKFCHRHLVAEWLTNNGFKTVEITDENEGNFSWIWKM